MRTEKTHLSKSPNPASLRTRTWQLANVGAFLFMITLNMLATLLPLNGVTTGQLSDEYVNLFTPAGVTFSIWGVIYTLLLAFVLYQLEGFFKGTMLPVARQITPLFLVSCIANGLWILCWHYRMVAVSVCVMLLLLVTLIFLYSTLSRRKLSPKETWWIQLPFRVYLGWITVATIANITILLQAIGWDGWGISPQTWTIVVLLTGLLIASSIIYRFRDPAYGLVIVWAYLGIWIKHSTPEGFNGQYERIITTVTASLCVLMVFILYAFLQNRRAHRKIVT